jgi:hypothetical protein
MSELPPGFVIDSQPKARQDVPALPDGFVIDQQQDAPPSVAGTIGRSAVRGATVGFQDELSGLAASAPGGMGEREAARQKYYAEGGFPSLPDPISVIAGGVNRLFGNKQAEYDAAVAQQRAMATADREANPIASIAGEIAGGIALPVGPITSAAQGLKTGAVLGGLYGFGEGEGFENSAGKALQNAALGGVIGGVAGKVFGGAGKPPPAAPASPVVDDATQFGIGLTSGQKTGDIAALSRENAMLGGGMGERAQKIASEATQRQAAEIEAARAGIGSRVGGGADAPVLDTAANVAGTVQQRAVEGRAAVSKAYDDAFRRHGEFAPDVIGGMGARIKDQFARGTDIVIAPETTPVATRALSVLDDISAFKLNRAGNGVQPGDEIAGVTLQGIDAARKRLQALSRAVSPVMPEDKRAMRAIIEQFDTTIEQAMTTGLFRGDDAALDALKKARRMNAEWYRTFRASGVGDDAGKIIQKMADPNANITPVEVANAMFGASRIGEKGVSVRLAGKLKSMFGEGSDEFNSIRQAAWEKLTGTVEGKDAKGAQKIASNISDFVMGNGAPLARELFTKDELNQMVKFANVLKTTVPPKSATNAPNSGNRVSALMTPLARSIGEMLSGGAGAMVGNVPGAVAGIALAKGAGAVKDWRTAVEATRAFSGDLSRPLGEKIAAKIGKGGAVSPAPVCPGYG